MDPGEDQTNDPGSEDEGKEKETTEDSGEANVEDNFKGMEFFFISDVYVSLIRTHR